MTMPYTSQTKIDAEIIEEVLAMAANENDHITVLEIGTYNGDTSREIKRWCDERAVVLEFWGVEAGWHPDLAGKSKIPTAFPGANMVFGDSAEVFHRIPFGFDVVLIDGCHCVNHVILDTIHYGDRVVPGGFMMFHDTAPHIQQTMRDPHGPEIPEFYNSVNKAHLLMGFPNKNWEINKWGYDPTAAWGGIIAYRKRL